MYAFSNIVVAEGGIGLDSKQTKKEEIRNKLLEQQGEAMLAPVKLF